MFILGTKWWKHGTKEPKECIQQWAFEGTGQHTHYSRIGSFFRVNGSAGGPNKTGFANIQNSGDGSNFTNWDGLSSPKRDGMAKALNFGIIRRVELAVLVNTYTDTLSWDLWKDERTIQRHIFDILPGDTGGLLPGLNMFEEMVFDHQYGWGFTSLSGVQPDNGEELHFSITCEIQWGAGDPD